MLLCQGNARAQTAPAGGSLVNLVTTMSNSGVFVYDALERQSALANDTAFVNLQSQCGNLQAPSCTGSTLNLFNRLRELEDNANELLDNGGEQQFSLHLDPSGVAETLRWTAPEEFAAQGSMASKFANSQTAVLTSRFAALRFASQGARLAQGGSAQPPNDGWSFQYNGNALGGAAGADAGGAAFSRWSAFVNTGYGSGSKDPTVLEDAFNFNSTEISVGADVRLTNRLVVGLLVGHSEKRVAFNSTQSVVDGAIHGNGQSALAYLQFEGDAVYLNVSVGSQHLSLATRRRITYPSNNPAVAPVDETSYSNTGATSWIATAGAGYTFHVRGFSADPYLNLESVSTHIAGFSEYNGNGFDLDTPAQSIPSLQAALGVKVTYAVLGPFGVVVPYAYGEARRQFRDSSRTIGSTYTNGVGGTDFELPTDEPTRHYYVVGGGGSVVLKHGLQGFLQYSRILDYTNYTYHVISGGLRWEF
jgi:outer membrane lipase/esterase